jgi:putative pyruvate formate lyase activating enzyme
MGVHNINLVTPSHFILSIIEAIQYSKEMGLKLPFIYNSNGYDSVSSLKKINGMIDIYMPDLKYANNEFGLKYSNVADYFTIAQAALLEMYRQVGDPVIQNGIMQRGLLIRHLVMPGLIDDSIRILDWIKANTPTAIVNIMPQYRPEYIANRYKEINRRPTINEIKTVEAYSDELGLLVI